MGEPIDDLAGIRRNFQRARADLHAMVARSRALILQLTQTIAHANATLEQIRGQLPVVCGRRILIVDENTQAAHSLECGLANLGHTSESAHTSAGALLLVRNFIPDIMVVATVPGIAGIDLLRFLRAESGAHMIAMTAGSAAESIAHGFDDHVAQPVDVGELVRMVGTLAA